MKKDFSLASLANNSTFKTIAKLSFIISGAIFLASAFVLLCLRTEKLMNKIKEIEEKIKKEHLVRKVYDKIIGTIKMLIALVFPKLYLKGKEVIETEAAE